MRRIITLAGMGIAWLSLVAFVVAELPQATPPPPAAPRTVQFPKPVERMLPNGLRIVVAQRSEMPLVTAELLIKSGGEVDPAELSGVADMTAALLTKGTKTRSATQIAEQMEALGGLIGSSAAWDSSAVTISVSSPRVDSALELMADAVRSPAFKDEEIDRLRRESLDNLRIALGQPGAIARYVAARVVYQDSPYGHPLSGTPESLPRIKREDIARVHRVFYRPDNAMLIIGGDMTPEKGFALAQKYFGSWARPATDLPRVSMVPPTSESGSRRVLIIDKPDAGQAAVIAARSGINRGNPDYFRGIVANSVLNGYSGRLNQEIRIKRGLSYGAGSSLDSRRWAGAFSASAQTKNESGAQVASLILDEIRRLAVGDLSDVELTPRKAVLMGSYARAMETTRGLVDEVASLAIYGVNLDEINRYVGNVQSIKAEDIKSFAATKLNADGTNVIVVGDAKQFQPDLQREFPQLVVIPVSELDLNSAALRRAVSKN